MTLSEERLREMLAGLEGVTPGPWETDFVTIMRSKPDGWHDFISVVDTGDDEPILTATHIAHCDPDTMREILTLALAGLSLRSDAHTNGEVKVKPLEWEEVTSPREDNEPEPTGDWEAVSIVGGYYICLFEDHYEVTGMDGEYVERHCDDLYEAKAAAQADFGARIRSALELSK